jgi:hypothetical protein
MVGSDESSGSREVNQMRGALKTQAKREQTIPVIFERLFKVSQVAILMCACNSAHTLHLPQLRVLGRELY